MFFNICITGKDATEAFEDVGHSDEARELLSGLLVGDLEESNVSTKWYDDKKLRAKYPQAPSKSKKASSNPAVHSAVEKGSK